MSPPPDLVKVEPVLPPDAAHPSRDGKPQGEALPSSAGARDSGLRRYVDNPWVVLGTLFFVTAALGLPLLWASRGFSTFSKAVLSLVVTLYTALILWLFYMLMAWLIPSILESWRSL